MTIPRGQRYAATFALLTAAALAPLIGPTTSAHAAGLAPGPDCSIQSQAVADANADVLTKRTTYRQAVAAVNATQTDVAGKKSAYDDALAALAPARTNLTEARTGYQQAVAAVTSAKADVAAKQTAYNEAAPADRPDARTALLDAKAALVTAVGNRTTASENLAEATTAYQQAAGPVTSALTAYNQAKADRVAAVSVRTSADNALTAARTAVSDAQTALATCQIAPYATVSNLQGSGPNVTGDVTFANLDANGFYMFANAAEDCYSYYCGLASNRGSTERTLAGSYLGVCDNVGTNTYQVYNFTNGQYLFSLTVDYSSQCGVF